MPKATIQVAAVTSPNQWTLGAGANKVVAVNAPDDDNTTYLSSTGAAARQQYSLATNTIPSGSIINSVSAVMRCLTTSGGRHSRVGFHLSGYTSSSDYQSPSSWTTFSEIMPRPGSPPGSPWALADLTTLQISAYCVLSGSVKLTSLWIVVDYTPPEAMFLMFR